MGHKDTKFSLGTEEMSLLANTHFFEQKRMVLNLIVQWLGELESTYMQIAGDHTLVVPKEALQKRGKISRGENYRGLPYLILDHPAYFSKQGIFAFRTLIWWGNPISITFHISGEYLQKFKMKLVAGLPKQNLTNLFICINTNQFEHHFESNNYILLHDFISKNGNLENLINERGFLKILHKMPLTAIHELQEQGPMFLKNILTILR